MQDAHVWLPERCCLVHCGGSWEVYLEELYRLFRRDFVAAVAYCLTKRVGIRKHLIKGKEETFWHLISEGEKEENRIPELRRCECIRWPRAVIDSVDVHEVRVWTSQRRKEDRVLLALNDFSYLVVLGSRDSYMLLLSAYPIERLHHREKLAAEYGKNKLR